MNFQDEMANLIRNRFAPDIMTTMRDCDIMELSSPSKSVNVPLRADVRIVYEKELAAFTIAAYVHDINEGDCLMARQVFSTREFVNAGDKADVIHYLFKKLEAQFLHALAKGELDKLIERK